jgi:hypothetical protein
MKKAPSSRMIFYAWLILAKSALVSTPALSDPLADRSSQQLAFLRGAKETMVIEGSTLRLQASISRNFMPVIIDVNSTRLGATISLIDVNEKPVPPTLHAETVWVVQNDRVWTTNKVEEREGDDANPSIRNFTVGNGPKWPTQSYVDVFVRIADQNGVHYLLVLRHQIIGRSV